MKVILVAGARPNFMKIAPIMRAMNKYNRENEQVFEPVLVHTGQHYDIEMSEVFFDELGLPEPDINLEVGSGSHAVQTAAVMEKIEDVFVRERPALVIVVGDVNSTLAAALTAAKLCIPVAHVEAGLRSFDKSMPEEINRVVSDAVSDMLFTSDEIANENLAKEGVNSERVFHVGDLMVDTLYAQMEAIDMCNTASELGLNEGDCAVVTLHRPCNVDNRETLKGIIDSVQNIAQKIKVVFPCHPRTEKRISEFGIETGDILMERPMPYHEFMSLVKLSRLVITDSGGIQQETTVLGKPCLTLREVVERPVTWQKGTNHLVGDNPEKITSEALRILDEDVSEYDVPELWDGHAGERIVEVLAEKRDMIDRKTL